LRLFDVISNKEKLFLAFPPPGHCEQSEATGGDRGGKKAKINFKQSKS
jgi:hypothetical protein